MKKINYEIQMIARMVADHSEYYNNSNMLHQALFIKHGDIFKHVVDMLNKGTIPSYDNLMKYFEAQQDTILDIISDLDYTLPTQLVIQELHENYRITTINNGLTRSGMAKTSEEKMNILTSTLTELEKYEVRQEIYHSFDVAKELIERLSSGIESGIKTDFTDFDLHTGGFQPSDLIVIAARSSQGKTSLALTICNNLIKMDKKCLFISMELSKPQLILRLLSGMVDISSKIAKDRINIFANAAAGLKDNHFYLADVSNTNYRNIIGLIRSAKIKYGIEIAFIDYLQLMRSDEHRNREQEIGSMARAFKNIAKELDMPIVLLSQLSRDEGRNPEPRLDSLRDSGQIEEAADIVWLLYRPEFYRIEEYTMFNNGEPETVPSKGRAFHIIAKGRNYGTTTFETGFNSKYAKFTETKNSFQPIQKEINYDDSPGDNKIKPRANFSSSDSGEEIPF